MISHKHKLIFFHIPKTGGTTIEKIFHVAPFDTSKPDYKNLVGWCPELKLHLQHATPKQLLEFNLINIKTFTSYYKFAFVRNPFTRAISDYHWNLKSTGGKGSFNEYLTSRGVFKEFHVKNGTTKDYTSHILNQYYYLTINDCYVMDEIFYFEDFQNELNRLLSMLNILIEEIPHEKKGSAIYLKRYYSLINRLALWRRDKRDLKYLKYKFPR